MKHPRCFDFCILWLLLAVHLSATEQSAPVPAPSAASSSAVFLRVSKEELVVKLSLSQTAEKSTQARVSLKLLNPENAVRAQHASTAELAPRQNELVVKLPKPFEKIPAGEMNELHWLRVQYQVTAPDGALLASGIDALRGAVTDPFVFTAAAGRMAAEGRPYHVRVHAQSNDGKPFHAIEIKGELAWDDEKGEQKLSAQAFTNGAGNAVLEFSVPNVVHASDGELTVVASHGLVTRSVRRNVDFRAVSYLLLDTDKDIYQPGQTVHARVLHFDGRRKAVEKDPLDVRIIDQSRTLVSRQTLTTDSFGVAHIDWTIPVNALQGNYSIRVESPADDQENNWSPRAEKSVHIYRYDLPNFHVDTKPDRAYYLPAQNAEISVSADYLFGKPVKHGKVRVVQEEERNWDFRKQQWDTKEGQVQSGELDSAGHFTARFDLRSFHDDLADETYSRFRDLNLAAYVTDLTTGRTEQRRFSLRVTRDPIHVYITPDGPRTKELSSYYISTSYADGAPARCSLRLSAFDENDKGQPKRFLRTIETNKYGLAKLSDLKVDDDDLSLLVEARDNKGLTGHDVESLSQHESDGIFISSHRTIHKAGDPIEISLRGTAPDLRLLVEVVREGNVLASQTARLRRGQAFLVFPYDPRFTDEVAVVAYSLEKQSSEYSYVWGTRSVLYPKNRQLGVAVQLDKDEHRPGEPATARFSVHLADAGTSESVLGVKIVDAAVEDRARTDADFGQRSGWGWWRWSLWSDSEAGFGAVSRDDLDQIDLSQPVPDDLDLVAEYILHGTYWDVPELLDDHPDRTAAIAFHQLVSQQFTPIEKGLIFWNEQGKIPRDQAQLVELGKEFGVEVGNLRDPWGTAYRYDFAFSGSNYILTVKSAGPDKQFGTSDDFVAYATPHPFFRHVGDLLDQRTADLMDKEGRFIRDRATLQAEMFKRGVDFDALRDPWGLPYEPRFTVQGTYYVTQVVSHGEDKLRSNPGGTIVWQNRIDYFAKSRQRIDQILSGRLHSVGTYPADDDDFRALLRGAGVDLSELRDPWGSPYYIVFSNVAEYGDRVSIRQTSTAGERSTEPVTMVRREVRVMSAGWDAKPGTSDDFQVASYSVLVSQQSARDEVPKPAPAPLNLTADTGAIAGSVFDPTGAVIAGATIQATREVTGDKYVVQTDSVGKFEFKNLKPGSYSLLASMTGFQSLSVGAIPVRAMHLTEISFRLSVGMTSATVEVTAQSVSLETTSMSMSEIAGRYGNPLPKLTPGAILVAKPGEMSTPRLRQDFPETMLWEPALVTDRRGHARLNFKLADNITTWKLTAVASTKNGELGRAEKDLRAFQPFFVEHDPPRILTLGDEIAYPVVLRNYLDRPQILKASIKPEPWFTLLGSADAPVHVDSGDAARAVFRYRTIAPVTGGQQQVSAANADISDAAQKPVDVHPFGQPTSVTAGTVMDREGTVVLNAPDNAIPGSFHARVKVYPNLLAHAVENLEAGLERPHGCGEQTISSTYPSLLVAQVYAKAKEQPAVALKAHRYLEAGYERLLRYQDSTGGFTYWGRGNPDIALSAYALEFLSSASSLIDVDPGVAQRTEQWLLTQQGTDGAWRSYKGSNDQDAVLETAYTAGVLAEGTEPLANQAGRRASLDKALSFLATHRDLMDEPYVMAEYVLAARADGHQTVANDLLATLRRTVHHEDKTAYWALERNTPFYGWGRTGRLESTAVVLQALAVTGKSSDQDLTREGLLFLLRNEDKDGMWYCGQTTVRVLRTLLAMVNVREHEAAGELRVRVNGKDAKIPLPAAQTVVAPVELDVTNLAAPGENRVELASSGAGMMSVQMVVDAYVPWGDDVPETVKSEPNASSTLKFAVAYSQTHGITGDPIQCHVRAERVGYRGYGMMLAEVGLPPAADVDRESLEQALEGNGSVSRYDVLPDRVILYLWPSAGGSEFSFQFRPRYGMTAQTAPSQLYDYYNPEALVTLKPERFEITESKPN